MTSFFSPKQTVNPESKSRLVLMAAVLLPVSLLAGCVVGPDRTAINFTAPAHWGSRPKDTSPPQLAEWWKKLHDPTLNALIAEAVQGNLDVATATAKIREARASYREQKGALLPTVDASAPATRTRTAAASGSAASIASQYQPGFDASWELDLFGENRRGA
ncbi:MAG: TolC family protein, partial [Rhizobiaceae bacterium]|nr:TolC family protein [Rhizobiaceae bacterium]